LSETGSSFFNSGPLFQIETIDASEEMIREYPYDGEDGLDLVDLQISFRFTGLPRAAFSRYLDSHRLALALRTYAKSHLDREVTATDRATAGLFETHPLAVQAPTFPQVVLNLPLGYILSRLPRVDNSMSLARGDNRKEPVLQLGRMIDVMEPPHCWSADYTGSIVQRRDSPTLKRPQKQPNDPSGTERSSLPPIVLYQEENGGRLDTTGFEHVVQDFHHLKRFFSISSSSPQVLNFIRCITQFVSDMSRIEKEAANGTNDLTLDRSKTVAFVESWVLLKRLGEDTIASVLPETLKQTLADWRRCSERLYSHMTAKLPTSTFRDGVSVILTDSRCNGHFTSNGCFERSVRLPAALKAAKLAGAGFDPPATLVTEIPQKYIHYVEEKLLVKAHASAYLKRIKSRCSSAPSDSQVLKLTDDSSGEGGEDTCKLFFRMGCFCYPCPLLCLSFY